MCGARPFSYAIHNMTMPPGEIAVRLTGPNGEAWSWNETDHEQDPDNSVSGPALDFCLVVTQRRHLSDTQLDIVGDAASEWMSIAQAFAGGVGKGRQPGQFATP